MKRNRLEHRGFTLVELLVVIAVVAILAALLTSGLTRAKSDSHRVVCINNLRQWACLVQIYASDHKDRLPRKDAMDGINTWEMTGDLLSHDVWYNALPDTARIASMEQYSQTPASQQAFYAPGRLFHCPSVRFPDVSATYPIFSLAMNSKLMLDYEGFSGDPPPVPLPGAVSPPPIFGACKLGAIVIPTRTALFLDNGIPGEQQLCPFQAPYTGAPATFANQFPSRHERGANIAFCDGRVATLAGNSVVEMDPASVNCGRAIYPPVGVIWCPDPTQVP